MTPRVRLRKAAKPLALLVAIGLVSAVNGGLTGVGSAAADPDAGQVTPGTQPVAKTLTEHCVFADPLGAQPVSVTTSATLPLMAKVGETAKITGFTMKFALPQEVARSFLPAPTTTGGSLEGGLTVGLAVDVGGKKSTLPVPLTIVATPVPDTGDMTLLATGENPALEMAAAGAVKFDLAGPTLALRATPAAGVVDKTPAQQMTCTLDPNQNTDLGTILVLPAPVEVQPKPGQPQPKAAGKARVTPKDDPLPGNLVPITMAAVITMSTTSTVKKLGATATSDLAAMLDGLLLIDNDTGVVTLTGDATIPPVTLTFLGFGFMPITATAEFLPVDYHDSHAIEVSGSLNPDGTLPVHIDVMARLSNAKINGVPLDVGGDCVTERPVSIDMTGPFDAFGGGGTIGTDPDSPDPTYRGFTLPGFKNCGATEPLSKIFTGMSSGDGNQVHATISIFNGGCFEADHRNCPVSNPPAAAAKH
jgi:hypothetical protein